MPYVANKTHIKSIYIATFHASLKEMQMLDVLHTTGRIEYAFMLTQTMGFKSSNEKNNEKIRAIFAKNGWEISVTKTHAKVLLFETDKGKYVLETSSNMDKNPSMEQFSFEKDATLYDWYYEQLFMERADMIELEVEEGGAAEWQMTDWEPSEDTDALFLTQAEPNVLSDL